MIYDCNASPAIFFGFGDAKKPVQLVPRARRHPGEAGAADSLACHMALATHAV